jgi:hypothetical protein
MCVKRGTTEEGYGVALQRLRNKAKAGLPEPQSPGVQPHTRRYHICYRRPQKPRVRLLLVVRPVCGPMRSEGIQGDEWGAYVVLETFLSDGTWEGLRPARARVTECQ